MTIKKLLITLLIGSFLISCNGYQTCWDCRYGGYYYLIYKPDDTMYSGADTGILFTIDTLNYYRSIGFPIDSINANRFEEYACNIDRVNELKFFNSRTFGVTIYCTEKKVKR